MWWFAEMNAVRRQADTILREQQQMAVFILQHNLYITCDFSVKFDKRGLKGIIDIHLFMYALVGEEGMKLFCQYREECK